MVQSTGGARPPHRSGGLHEDEDQTCRHAVHELGLLIGAATGMAIDLARKGETDLYVAAPPARVALSPFLSPRMVGAAASVRW